MTWQEYYNKFFDWANSTQISRISKLTSFGDPNEICEVANELCDETAATRLIKKAVASGVAFSADQIIDLMDALGEDGMNCVITASKCKFTREQLDDLCCAASDDVFEAAASRSGINYYEDDDDYDVKLEPEDADDDFFAEPEPQPKIGFFGQLFIALGFMSIFDDIHKKHNKRCKGNCANCPPHYGYRHGGWYYGHHHQHGCEFGGNKGK